MGSTMVLFRFPNHVSYIFHIRAGVDSEELRAVFRTSYVIVLYAAIKVETTLLCNLRVGGSWQWSLR